MAAASCSATAFQVKRRSNEEVILESPPHDDTASTFWQQTMQSVNPVRSHIAPGRLFESDDSRVLHLAHLQGSSRTIENDEDSCKVAVTESLDSDSSCSVSIVMCTSASIASSVVNGSPVTSRSPLPRSPRRSPARAPPASIGRPPRPGMDSFRKAESLPQMQPLEALPESATQGAMPSSARLNMHGGDFSRIGKVWPAMQQELIQEFIDELHYCRSQNRCVYPFPSRSLSSSQSARLAKHDDLDRRYAEFCQLRETLQNGSSSLCSVLCEASHRGHETLTEESVELWRHLGDALACAVVATAESSDVHKDGEAPLRDDEARIVSRLSENLANQLKHPKANPPTAPQASSQEVAIAASGSSAVMSSATKAQASVSPLWPASKSCHSPPSRTKKVIQPPPRSDNRAKPALSAVPLDSSSEPGTPARPVNRKGSLSARIQALSHADLESNKEKEHRDLSRFTDSSLALSASPGTDEDSFVDSGLGF